LGTHEPPRRKADRVRIAIPVLGFTRSGGARVLSELASAWVREGHEVAFLCSSSESEPYFPTLAQIVRGKSAAHEGLGRQWLELARLVRSQAQATDSLLANFHLTAWAVWAAGPTARKRATYYSQAFEAEFYDEHPSTLRRIMLQSLARMSLRLLPRLVVNAPVYLDYPGVRAVGWVPPGVDFKRFRPRAEAVRSPREDKSVILGCIGRPERWKGTPDVIDAAANLVARGVNVHLRVAYHVPCALPALLTSRVELVVPRNDDELADFYRSVDLLIAPGTIQLGAPHYPVMEAMACNVPVITTGYLPASEDNALIVPTGRPDAIANSVIAAICAPEATAARADRAKAAMAPFAWPEVARRLLALMASGTTTDRNRGS
jgi:glycosyltransferase involved in cell wall biosynthesis